MAKRWTFSECDMFYDPDGLVGKLLQMKVPLQPEERKWQLISGTTLSEWYINRLAADYKWRFFYAANLEILPDNSNERMESVLSVNALTLEELERIRNAFVEMGRQVLPLVEREVQMKYEDFKDTM